MPEWLAEDYFHAIGERRRLGQRGSTREEAETVSSILSVTAIAKGLRTHGKFLVEYSDAELLDMEFRQP